MKSYYKRLELMATVNPDLFNIMYCSYPIVRERYYKNMRRPNRQKNQAYTLECMNKHIAKKKK